MRRQKDVFHLYQSKIIAAVDQVEGLGDYLELEIIEQEEEQRPAYLEEIEAVMKE